MVFQSLDRYRDHGLLLLRVGLGLMFLFHGVPKLVGGPELWERLGGAMAHLGITFAPTFWGLMAGLSESVGGLLLLLGLATRPALAFLVTTMTVAAAHHLASGDGLKGAAHAVELGIVFLSLLLIGPGRFSIDGRLAGEAARER